MQPASVQWDQWVQRAAFPGGTRCGNRIVSIRGASASEM